jgi:hypothetical protein
LQEEEEEVEKEKEEGTVLSWRDRYSVAILIVGVVNAFGML